MKKNFVWLLLAISLAASACGNKQTSVPVPEPEPEPPKEEEVEESVVIELYEEEEDEEEVPEASAEEAETDGTATYVEENELKYSPIFGLHTKGYCFDEDKHEENEQIDIDISMQNIEIRDSEKEGYDEILVEYIAVGNIWYMDDEHKKNYIIVPIFYVCDAYTGRLVPSVSLAGDDEFEFFTEVEWEGTTYEIGYNRTSRWEKNEWWDSNPDGSQSLTEYNYGSYTITVPKEYDGLALLMSPLTEFPDDLHYDVLDDGEKYIMDLWTEDSILLDVRKIYNDVYNK